MNNNLENIRIFSEDVIPVYDTDTGEKVVLGRELHEKLKIKTPYHIWFPRMAVSYTHLTLPTTGDV